MNAIPTEGVKDPPLKSLVGALSVNCCHSPELVNPELSVEWLKTLLEMSFLDCSDTPSVDGLISIGVGAESK